MAKFDINKEYSLKLGEADSVNSIYLGVKRYKGDAYRHVFLVYGLSNRSFMAPRFYLGKLNKVTFKEGIIQIKEPLFKKVNPLEEKSLSHLIDKLKNQ